MARKSANMARKSSDQPPVPPPDHGGGGRQVRCDSCRSMVRVGFELKKFTCPVCYAVRDLPEASRGGERRCTDAVDSPPGVPRLPCPSYAVESIGSRVANEADTVLRRCSTAFVSEEVTGPLKANRLGKFATGLPKADHCFPRGKPMINAPRGGPRFPSLNCAGDIGSHVPQEAYEVAIEEEQEEDEGGKVTETFTDYCPYRLFNRVKLAFHAFKYQKVLRNWSTDVTDTQKANRLGEFATGLPKADHCSPRRKPMINAPRAGPRFPSLNCEGDTGSHVPQEVYEVAIEEEQEEDEGGTVTETFTDYRPSRLSIGPLHPDPIVETSSLSAVTPPEPKYNLRIEGLLERSKALSCLQIETVVYASQRHRQHLPDGTRAGFLIGDGAGVGKGRTVGGLIWENWWFGRRKALWISVGSDLYYDAKRDLVDVGAGHIEVHELNKLPYSELDSASVGIKDGVIFLTYSSLTAKSAKSGLSRLQQLVQWCGPGFDGLIIFDESHKAKNLVPAASRKPTLTGKAVLEIQEQLPEARVVYCSATGASEPHNMAYLIRLGLWGDGTCFSDFADFSGALEKGGVGALELVAMDMKARGMYLCRSLSYKGAEFEVVEAPLNVTMVETYKAAVELWVALREELLCFTSESSLLWRSYWLTHQIFFRHMCMSAKVSTAVRLAKQALNEGKCVVIGLQSTGEARTEDAVAKYGSELDDFISGPRELLLKFVEEHCFLPQTPVEVPDKENLKVLKRKRNSETPIGSEIQDCYFNYRHTRLLESSKSRFLDRIHSLDLPRNALDDIIDQLGGPDKVAEITGRRGRLVRSSGGVSYQARNIKNVKKDLVNMHEKEQFMNGNKLIAIISEAGSAGVSLQADRRAANQRRRVHLTLELPWSADRAIQQFGRTHRSNQSSAPQYRLLFTNLGGERRFASTVAKRLESLGALTQGDRRAGPSLSAYNYVTKYGKQALRIIYEAILEKATFPVAPPGCSFERLDSIKDFIARAKTALVSVGIIAEHNDGQNKSVKFGGSIIEAKMQKVERFLNRLLGMPPEIQNSLFELFVTTLEHVIQNARLLGTFDNGVKDYRAKFIELQGTAKTFHTDDTSAKLYTFKVDRGISWETASALLTEKQNSGNPKNGFYVSEKGLMGKRHFLLAYEGSTSGMYKIVRPYIETAREMSLVELEKRFTKVASLARAQAGWEAEHAVSSKQCMHGPNCKEAEFCQAGRSRLKVCILGGVILPIWRIIEKTLAKQQTKFKRRLRVMQIETTDGTLRIIGIHIPNTAVESVLKDLKWVHDVADD